MKWAARILAATTETIPQMTSLRTDVRNVRCRGNITLFQLVTHLPALYPKHVFSIRSKWINAKQVPQAMTWCVCELNIKPKHKRLLGVKSETDGRRFLLGGGGGVFTIVKGTTPVSSSSGLSGGLVSLVEWFG